MPAAPGAGGEAGYVDQGPLCLTVPAEHGGGDFSYAAVLVEELS
ncbi:acyl-CoA dehydrogenase family protein [Pseudomonas sp. LS44]|nr:acyl-CoA dehydrogenase family protein [Pseudomonas sp. LS44]UVE15968.1 acyl-CoA dehydrogenase family protein [Pseudomonas sp. LS44]